MDMTEEDTKKKFEYEQKKERIADYFDICEAEENSKPMERNEGLVYGKFDPIYLDPFGTELALKISKTRQVKEVSNRRLYDVLSFNSQKLQSILSRIKPVKKHRSWFYIINMRLSELGVAPRWRKNIHPAPRASKGHWSDAESQHMKDIQVFDLEWIYRRYPKHRVRSMYSQLLEKLMEQDRFDYALAHMIAAAEITAEKKATALKLTSDMEAELSIIHSKKIGREYRSLLKKREEVEVDLITAANRNRNRGKKLLEVIPDKLDIWLSAAMSNSDSESVMRENYEKITGVSITRSTYRSRLKSLNKTLLEVGSKHAF